MGRVIVISPCSGMTLLAIAKALLKIVLISSMENVAGSPAWLVHVKVTCPPEVGFWGMLI